MRPVYLALVLAALSAGCAVSPAPEASGAAGHLGLGQVAALGGATAAAAVLGEKVGGNAGALIGGSAGLAAAALINNALTRSTDQLAADQARRDERLSLMQRYWNEHTAAGPEGSAGGSGPAPESPAGGALTYPAGVYQGLRFAPRTAPDPNLTEPFR